MGAVGDTPGNRPRVDFPKFQFWILFLPVALAVVVTGLSFATIRTDASIERMQDQDGSRLYLISGFIGAAVSSSLYHLRALAAEPATTRALDSDDPADLHSLETSFLTLASRNPLYQQVRWIDELGMERVRVMRDGGALFAVGPEALQSKSSRYYFEKSASLSPGEFYVSPVDLNVEHGEVEIPPRPVLRVATPVESGNHERRGVIVLNISMKHLLDIAEMPRWSEDKVGLLLLNNEGVRLNHRINGSKATGEGSEGLSFADDHRRVWTVIAATESGVFEDSDGLWTWKTLSPVDTYNRLAEAFPQRWSDPSHLIFDDFALTLVVHRPVQTLVEIRRDNRLMASLGIVLTVSLFGSTLYLYLSSHVRTKWAELKATRAIENASYMARLKELETRFHRLVDASSIGHLVVSADGRVQVSNPAVEEMLGYTKKELLGMLVDDLLPASLRAAHLRERQAFMRAPQARKMGEGRELAAARKNGSLIPVEVGLNPYTDQGESLVLVSMIDISAKRREGSG